jgi:lipopolysaccharide biosynthesis regulator YciM
MRTISEIRELCRRKQYAAALVEIEKNEQMGIVSSQLLVLKGRCLQQEGVEQNYTLEDAETALVAALELESESVEALTELGWFYFKHDQAEHALSFFQRAFEVANAQLSEAATGVARCLHEVWGPEDALRYLGRVREQVVDEMILEGVQEEMKDF